jgi:hypothetical protein
MPKALPEHYLQMRHVPKREESISHGHFGYVLPPLPSSTPPSGPSPSISRMDTIMTEAVDPSSARSHKFHFGIDGMNKLISQMLEQPILNIVYQKRTEICDAIHLLRN